MGHMRRIASLSMAAALAGCATTPATPDGRGIAWAGIGETVYVDGPKVTPVELLEDSRCPQDVQCVWAGQVRIRARIDLGSGSTIRELTLGKPAQVSDGALELVEVRPSRQSAATVPDGDYRFGFTFAGGI